MPRRTAPPTETSRPVPEIRITEVEPVVLHAEIPEPVRTSFGTMEHRWSVLVRIGTDAGVEGWGESWCNFPSWAPFERVHTLRGLAPLVVGQDPRDVVGLHGRMREATRVLVRQWGAPGPVSQSIAAIDVALWDLLGKLTDQPIVRLLGGREGMDVPVYGSGLGPGDPAPLLERLQAAGVAAYKLKVGFGSEQDARSLTRMRKLIGDDAVLWVDANQAWSLPAAREALSMLGDHGVDLLEEPLPSGDYLGLARLRDVARIPIAAGENAFGREDFVAMLGSGCIDVVQPDVAKCGGLTDARFACQLAAAHGRAFAPHYLSGAVGLIASLHLFASCPGGTMMELDANPNPLRDELGGELVRAVDGHLRVPSGPGLGFAPSPETLERYRFAVEE